MYGDFLINEGLIEIESLDIDFMESIFPNIGEVMKKSLELHEL